MHKLKPSLIIFTLLLTIILVGCSTLRNTAGASKGKKPLFVFLVRHAEKADNSSDAALSDVGNERARALAHALRNAEIEYIHSSDFIRTRETVAPIVEAHGLEVELYDPHDLPALVDKLRATGGRHLVVGHSNTTPALAKLLGGEAGSPINEVREYDRLYMVSMGRKGETSSVLLRYGRPFDPGKD